MSLPNRYVVDLPDVFAWREGRRVARVDDWRERRQEILDLVVDIEYGGLPPTPSGVTGEKLHTFKAKRFGEATYTQYRLLNDDDRSFHFRLDILVPAGEGPFPVVLTGDGCYLFVTDELRADMLTRGFALATFSRTAIVPDLYNSDRDSGLYLVYPEARFGALAAWAWGYHRCVDLLTRLPEIAADKIAVVGHSRGGKTVLLAAATDERIALTAPNASGSGGTGSFKFLGPDCETLEDSLKMIPYWYGQKLHDYIGRVDALPFDQHFLRAAVAPRPQLNTIGLDDFWANPRGTWQTHLATREVYRFLGVEERLGFWSRPGGHDHGWDDWQAFLDFMAWQLRGGKPPRRFDLNPYPDMPPAFAWSAPQPNDSEVGT